MFRLPVRSPFVFAAFSALVLIGLAACADLKSANPGTGDDTDGGGSAATTSGGSQARTGDVPSGPGAHGSLPSGYCCEADTECRGRHCVAVPGGGSAKVCEDACHEQGSCLRTGFSAFTCSAKTPDDDGYCEPPISGFTCIPQGMFIRGTRQVLECCTATGDGNSGAECEANRCISYGVNGEDGPFYCTQACATPRDCPSGTVCGPYGTCDPGNFPYMCK